MATHAYQKQTGSRTMHMGRPADVWSQPSPLPTLPLTHPYPDPCFSLKAQNLPSLTTPRSIRPSRPHTPLFISAHFSLSRASCTHAIFISLLMLGIIAHTYIPLPLINLDNHTSTSRNPRNKAGALSLQWL